MIHSVVCVSIVEKQAAVNFFQGQGLTVTWFGPDDVVRAEHFSGAALQTCGTCEAGPAAYLVVAYPAGEGPFPG